MCRDISERVATQRQLEVFKSVLDKVSDSILAVSKDGTLVYANKQFIEEYGVTKELGIQKVYDLPVSMTTKEAWEKRLQEIRDNDGSLPTVPLTYVWERRRSGCTRCLLS